ncbi:hypothetical protein Rcae01_03347 [Novipirellula caenicola]|uniref:Uncharacterized protein n=1 Tax=Novipirellula caenicola TaxID=1536901 RepID=A0ABP9VRU4_9BACT
MIRRWHNAFDIRCNVLFIGIMVMISFVTMMVSVRMHMYMRTQSMTIRLSNAGSRVRMRQSLPQHKKGNQQ